MYSTFVLRNNPPTPPNLHLFIKLALALPAFPVPSCLLLLIVTWGKSRYVADLFKMGISQPLMQIQILENQASDDDMASYLGCVF